MLRAMLTLALAAFLTTTLAGCIVVDDGPHWGWGCVHPLKIEIDD